MALERARMIKSLFKNTTDCCWHNSVTVGTWGGLTGMRGGGSFLCGDDLQSRSSTGPPFNQRYLNCIVWPLWRALLRDIARPLRLQHFEDIIDGSFSLDVWDSQGNYKHQRLIIRLFFHTNNSPSVMNRVVVTAKQTSALITDWWTLQLWYFPCISLSSPIHVQVEGTAVSVGWASPFFTSASFPVRISRHSMARWERLPPNWTQNTGRHKSDLSNTQMSELVTWPLRLNPANHSPMLLPSRPALMHPVSFSRLSCYHLVNSAGAVVTPGRTRGLCLCGWHWYWAWLKVNKQLADVCWVEI